MKTSVKMLFIIFLGFFIRVIFLNSNPPHLNWDEVSIGYNAFSILKTGRDEWGQFLPIIFRAYGDFKLPFYLYSTTISIFVFGLNEFAVRFPSVVAGVVTIIFTYLLSVQVFKKQNVGLLASLLVAIEPWSFFLSRVALEANLALALIVSGVYFLIKGLEENKNKPLYISALLLGLSVWTYNSARIFVPLLAFFSLVVYKDQIFKNIKNKIGIFAVLSLFFIPMFVQLVMQEGSARYENVKILDQGAIARIIENRNASEYPEIANRIIYNRYTYFAQEFSKNYLSHFSINYLFENGGDNYQFSVPQNGLLYKINFAFLVIGLFIFSFRIENRKHLVLLSWFLLAPIASSLTRETPHVLRNIVFLPLPMILTALGFDFIITNFSKYKNIFISLYVILLSLMSVLYMNNYFNNYKVEHSQSWQYGNSDLVKYIANNYDKYDTIIVTKNYGEIHEFLLFYGSMAKQDWAMPASYQVDTNLNRFYQSNWYWVDGFDKFYFVNDWQIPKVNEQSFVLESGQEINLQGKNVLFVTTPENYPPRFVKVQTINFLDEKPVYDLVEAQY